VGGTVSISTTLVMGGASTSGTNVVTELSGSIDPILFPVSFGSWLANLLVWGDCTGVPT
jgi:hypothetical protein